MTALFDNICINLNNKLFQAKSYLSYLGKSGNRHAVHSPFVYAMADLLLRKKPTDQILEEIEKCRKTFLTSKEYVEIKDLGAGSRAGKKEKRKVKTIAEYSLSHPRQCRLLFNLVSFYKPKYIVEIGTSLGISSAYLAAANDQAIVHTLEGSESILTRAKKMFDTLQLNNISPILGNFNETLSRLLTSMKQVDFAFIDGNHTYANTLDYFEQILKKSHNDTMILVDDIYWSEDMNRAWKEIQNHPSTRTTIDLFDLGIVLLRKEMTLEHFVLRYST